MIRPFLSTFLAMFMGIASLHASSEEFSFIMNNQVVKKKGAGLASLTCPVDSDNIFLNLKDKVGTCHFLSGAEPSVFERATQMHTTLASQIPGVSFPSITLECETIGNQHMAATDGAVVLKGPSVTLFSNIFCAKDDISVCASHISFLGVFLTSTAGKIILKAPDDCPGWLRSLTFERAPGERPFDMMFQGTVSFHPPSLEELLVAGTNKVTLGIVTS